MGIGPSTKETSLHHFRDPLLDVVSADTDVDLMGIVLVGSPDGNEDKMLVGTRAAVLAAAEHDGPVYMRFGRLAVPRIFDENYKFEIGKAVTLKEGSDVTIIATGLMVNEAIEAAKILESDGISANVINMHTIKPLDKAAVVEAAKKTGCIVTAEEHNVIGGLGDAVCDAVCSEYPVPVVKVGVEDTFGKSGPAVDLLHIFGLDAANIVEKAKIAISKK
jgi:transketolase